MHNGWPLKTTTIKHFQDSNMGTCIRCEIAPIENKTTNLCATCSAADRKAERQAIKDSLKKKPTPIAKATKPIKKVSDKMRKELKTYAQKRKEHLQAHPLCQIRLDVCTGQAFEVHHSAKRGANLNNEDTFMSACPECHTKVETVLSASERREKGFLK